MTIKGSLYLSIPMLKRFSVAKKTVQSKSVHKMAVFRKFKGLNIKYSYRDPKRHWMNFCWLSADGGHRLEPWANECNRLLTLRNWSFKPLCAFKRLNTGVLTTSKQGRR